jgi:Na+-transporting NADH:ubiquinone oxidoreductase subunit NqrB
MRLDNRLLIILLLAFVFFYGWQVLAWDFDFSKLLSIFLFGLLTQTLFCLAFKIPINALISTIVTTMLLGLLIRTEFIFICGMLSFFAVSSKYIFQYKGKHLFNPANFGLVFLMLFTQQAFITTHRLDMFLLIVVILGVIAVLWRSDAKKLDILLFYFTIHYLLSWLFTLFGWTTENVDWKNLWFLIYALILLVDPMSSPNSRIGRLVWSFFIVLSSLILKIKFNVLYADFFALAIAGVFMPIIDVLFNRDARFSWDSVQRRKLHSNDAQYTAT